MFDKNPTTYIMTNNHNTTLYVGVTSDLIKRKWQHKNNVVEGFTKKYNIKKLVYYEQHGNMYNAITREKLIKSGSRKKKIDLIEKMNPSWSDLYDALL